MNTYEDKLLREQSWHVESAFQAGHFLNSRLFYSPERQVYNYDTAKKAMAAALQQLPRSAGSSELSLLIAPVGSGHDIPYVEHLFARIQGVDISEEALAKISHPRVHTTQCDMNRMDVLPDDHFDVVLSPLFFHHFHGQFDPFLRSLVRVLKPGGHFVALEPSALHPVCWIAGTLRWIVGNITGLVDDEAPLIPGGLTRAMGRCGLRNVVVQGASFTHNRVPIWLARINNRLTRRLLKMPVVGHFAWMCVFIGQKPARSSAAA